MIRVSDAIVAIGRGKGEKAQEEGTYFAN